MDNLNEFLIYFHNGSTIAMRMSEQPPPINWQVYRLILIEAGIEPGSDDPENQEELEFWAEALLDDSNAVYDFVDSIGPSRSNSMRNWVKEIKRELLKENH